MGFIHTMEKALFLCLLVCTMVSCKKSDAEKLASASGKINNISVIIDDQLWNGEIGDTIRNKFASPILGLSQEEPLFTINQYPVKLLEGFMTNSRNILVIKKDKTKLFKIVSDEYAKPQNVFHISGQTVPEIIEIIEKNSPVIIQKMHDTEILEMQKRIDTALIDNKKIKSKFGITLTIPTGYKLAMQSDKFMWYKKEMISGNMSLLIYAVPPKCLQKNNDAIGNIVRMRDSVGNLYIKGTMPGSQMITEQAYSPYFSHIMLDKRKTFETRGTWELQNDYMSGPYINYAIVDKPNKRILVLEGFCYAPSKEKRDLMHELEAIIESVKILKTKK